MCIAYLQRACEGLDILPVAGAGDGFYPSSRFVFFCASDIRYSKGERIWMAF